MPPRPRRICTSCAAFGVRLEAGRSSRRRRPRRETLAARFPAGGRASSWASRDHRSACRPRVRGHHRSRGGKPIEVVVVAGLDRKFTYQKLQGRRHTYAGARPSTERIRTRLSPPHAGLVPGAGSIIAAIATAAEQQPTIIGKPSPLMFESAQREWSCPRTGSGRRRSAGNGHRGRAGLGRPDGARALGREHRRPSGRPGDRSPTLIAESLNQLLGA